MTQNQQFLKGEKMKKISFCEIMTLGVLLFGVALVGLNKSYAHCDTLNGPIVKAAKTALEKKDITPVLKWIKKENEKEVAQAFQNSLDVRTLSPQAKELADMYFFETLVRLHRTGEGAPYTGLKPADAVEPIVAAADKALETGSVEELSKELTAKIANGINTRFAKAIEKKKHSEESIEAGREFVEAYIEFVHYVEKLDLDAAGQAGHHDEVKESIPQNHHEHN
jgi:hypothetical protein